MQSERNPTAFPPAQVLSELTRLEQRGRNDAAPDGWSLFFAGALGGALFLVQYWAEANDWAPSFVLWWWQPLLILIWAAVLLTRHGLTGTAALGSEARTLRAVFLAVACGLAVPLVAQVYRGEVDGYASTLVLCTTMGGAFMVLARVSGRLWMLLPAAGWWCLLFVFISHGHLVLTDFFLLAMGCFCLLGVPGLVLRAQKSHGGAVSEVGD